MDLQQITERLTGLMTQYGINVLGAIVTLLAGVLLAEWASRLVNRAMRCTDRIDAVFRPLPGKVVKAAILVFTLVAVLSRFGLQTTSLIAVLGAVGLAVGLALQGTLSKVAAGAMVLLLRPFKIGDNIKLGGDVYVVDAIGFFVCKAHLPDGPSAIVPNSRIWGQTIVNLSVTHQNRRRFDQQNGSSYSDDIDKALAILRGIAADERRILKDPAPLIQVESLGDSSVNILLRVWTARADWLATQMELVQRYKVGLEGGGISLPFPQRDVHHFDAQGGTARSSSAAGQT